MNTSSASGISSKTFLVGMVVAQESADVAVIDAHGCVVERWVEGIDDASFERCVGRLQVWLPSMVVFVWDGGRCLAVVNRLHRADFPVHLLHPEIWAAFASWTGEALDAALVMRCVYETAPVLLPLPAEKMQDYEEVDARLRRQMSLLRERQDRQSEALPDAEPVDQEYLDWLADDIADGEQQMRELVKAIDEWLNREHRARMPRAVNGPVWADKCVLDMRMEDFL